MTDRFSCRRPDREKAGRMVVLGRVGVTLAAPASLRAWSNMSMHRRGKWANLVYYSVLAMGGLRLDGAGSFSAG